MTATAADAGVAFRVDAGIDIGFGHVMRCLALATQLQALGCAIHFICRDRAGHLGERITRLGFGLTLLPAVAEAVGQPTTGPWLGTDWQRDATETRACLERLAPSWLVVDHYGIDMRWEAVQPPNLRVAVIDDLADRAHRAELLVDPNLQPAPQRYAGLVPAGCRVLAGPRYALLRSEFSEPSVRRVPRDGHVRRILACVGGADPAGLLPVIVEAWTTLDRPRPALDVAVGGGGSELAVLRERCAAVPGCTLHVGSERMSALMDAADLLIGSAGTITWERCALGLPALVIEVAPNQHDNLQQIVRFRAGLGLGRSDDVVAGALGRLVQRLVGRPSLLRRLGLRAARLVDGAGAWRVAVAMNARRMSLRRATNDDADLAWQWRNDESTRRHSTDPHPIALEAHRRWWRQAVDAHDRSLLVAEVGCAAIGVVRLDDDMAGVATVSIYLDPRLTGLGLGRRLIDAARRWAPAHHAGLQRLHAVIEAGNIASAKAFAAAGFEAHGRHWSRAI